MAVTVDDCKGKMDALSKLVKDSSEYEIIKTFNNVYQVDAYKIKKKAESMNGLFKLILKIASEISVITGAISVLLGIFV